MAYRRTNKALPLLIIFGGMILLVSFGTLHLATAVVLAALLMVLVGVLAMNEAYASIEWQSVFLIAGMLPLGIAMEQTGTADFLSAQMIELVGGLGPRAIMIGLFLLTTIITEFMSNAAAAVLVAMTLLASLTSSNRLFCWVCAAELDNGRLHTPRHGCLEMRHEPRLSHHRRASPMLAVISPNWRS